MRAFCLAATFSISALLAAQVANAAALPAQMSDCTVDLAASKEAFAIMEIEGEIFKARGPLLQQQLALLGNPPPGSTKPLIEVLSRKDLVTFTEIRSKLLFTSMQYYLKSEHARDIKAIQTLWHIVMGRMGGAPNPSPDPKEPVLTGLIRAVDEKLADGPVKITVPENSASCDLPMALSIAESRLIQINNQQMKTMNSAIAWVDGLTAKHPEMHGTMSFGQLSAAEQTQYKKVVQDVLKPAIERQQAVKDAEYLKTMYQLSTERTTDGEQDLTKSGGDTEAVGATFKARARDATTQILVGALYYIGDKIPSEATIMDQQIVQQIQMIPTRP